MNITRLSERLGLARDEFLELIEFYKRRLGQFGIYRDF